MYAMIDTDKMSDSEKSMIGKLFLEIVLDLAKEHPEVLEESSQPVQKGAE